jgi:hypothetical protein
MDHGPVHRVGNSAWVAAPVAAQGEQGFTETFDDAQLPGWEHAPEVVVTDGALRIGPAQFASPMGAWQDFDLSFKLRFSGEGETHVNYRSTNQGSYLLLFGPGGVTLLKTAPQGEPQELGRAEAEAVNASDWVTVQIVLAGGGHTISINGETLITATDPDPLGPGGLVFVSVGQRTTDLDDVSLQTRAAEGGAGPAGPGNRPAPTAAATASACRRHLLAAPCAACFCPGQHLGADVFVINLSGGVNLLHPEPGISTGVAH